MAGPTDAVDTALDLFKELVWDNLVKAAIAQLFLEVPFLNWYPCNFVITFFINKYSDMFYGFVKIFIDIEKIIIINSAAKSSYDAASLKLHIIAKDSGIDSQAFKDQREIDIQNLSNFVQFGVSRNSN